MGGRAPPRGRLTPAIWSGPAAMQFDVMELARHLSVPVFGWVLAAPFWLAMLAALVRGRLVLSSDEIRRGLKWTAGLTAFVTFPSSWYLLAYFARFSVVPTSGWKTGGMLALALLPASSALAALLAFDQTLRVARSRGAVP